MTDEIKLQKCSACKSTQVQDQYFSINRRGVYHKTCNKCLERGRAYKASNKEKIKLYREANKDKTKQYYEDNKERIKQQREPNKEKIKQRMKQYREDNREKLKQQMKQYKEDNREKLKQYREDKRHYCEHNTPKHQCKICDPQGHLRHIVSSRIRHALKSDKTERSIEYLGCTIAEFKAHIESQFKENMTWENFGDWQIDHIVPIKYKKNGQNPTLEDVIERLHWKNTQPMWAKDNIAKGNRFIG